MDIIDALKQGGELEWYRRLPSNHAGEAQLHFPPVVVWRYKNPDEGIEAVIQLLICNFKGGVEWDIYLGGRNFVLKPKVLKDFLEKKKTRVDVEGIAQFAKKYPNVGTKANKELPKLADHISRGLKVRGVSP